MRGFTRLGTWFGAAMLVGAIASACGGSGEVTSSTTGTGGGGGSSSSTTTTTSSSSSGSGGKGGSGGMGGTGGMGTGGMGTGGMGTGGMAQGPHGPQASQLVNGGDVVKSPGYKMVFTIGQPTQNQTKTSSPSYRMQGGLIGANGTLP